MHIEEIAQKINSFYQTIDTFAISYDARQRLGIMEDKTLIYGEALPESLIKILKIAEPKEGEIFYDLGSGGGKVVLAAATMFPFGKTVGIEKIKELVEVSERAAREIGVSNAEFRCEDFFVTDFSDGDVIFIHSTCLPQEMMDILARKMENLKEGVRIITVTKQLKANYLEEFENKHFEFSWGLATVYFYKKTALHWLSAVP